MASVPVAVDERGSTLAGEISMRSHVFAVDIWTGWNPLEGPDLLSGERHPEARASYLPKPEHDLVAAMLALGHEFEIDHTLFKRYVYVRAIPWPIAIAIGHTLPEAEGDELP